MSATGAAKLERALRRASGDRPALAPFLTAGFPSRDGFDELLDRVCASADAVELGVPFSDPMADGVTIQRSSRVALEAGVTLPWILDVVRRARDETPIVLMSYLNPLLAFGVERLADEAAAAGVCGFVVPDLPFEECEMLREPLDRRGLALVQLVTPVTPASRLLRLCRESRGFVYAVTMTGTTGAAGVDAAGDYLDRVRAASPVPVLAGFGVRTAEQLRKIGAHVDGAIVGSALVEAIERGEDPVAFLVGLRAGRSS
jgi:tryptophan synthase alpha chain